MEDNNENPGQIQSTSVIINQEFGNDNQSKKIEKKKLRKPKRMVKIKEELKKIKSIEESGGKTKHFVCARFSLLFIDICTTILGIYILFNKEDYLSDKYDFDYSGLLFVFICFSTSNIFGILIVSFFLGFIVYLLFKCFYFRKKMIKNLKKNIENSDVSLTTNELKIEKKDLFNNQGEDIGDINAGIDADQYKLVPYAMTAFIILHIILYFIALPFSSFIFYTLITDQIYEDLGKFWPVYLICLLSFLSGVIIVAVLVAMILMQRKTNDILKRTMELDENRIIDLRNRVRDEMKKAI